MKKLTFVETATKSLDQALLEQTANWIKKKEKIIIQEFKTLVEIQTSTKNFSAINQLQDHLQTILEKQKFKVEQIHSTKSGNHLLAHLPYQPGKINIVLDCHIDTVFDPNSIAAFTLEPPKVYGQGVVDMKGGIIVALFSTFLLQQLAPQNLPNISIFIASDEEEGSYDSKRIIKELSSQYDLCLTFEEASKDEGIVIKRKGYADLTITTHGQAGHSGNTQNDRRNAIEELSYKIIDLRELAQTFPSSKLLFNAGKIEGGLASNVIAEKAICYCDIRYEKPVVLKNFINQAQTICNTQKIPKVTTNLKINHERHNPPLTTHPTSLKAAALFQNLFQKHFHRPIKLEHRGGGSNANIWSKHGVPSLDGFGPLGGQDHSPQEWVNLPSLMRRIQIVTLFLQKLSQINRKTLQETLINEIP